MLTFNKDYVFSNNAETSFEEANTVCCQQEADKELKRKAMLATVQKEGGLED
ncbi:hypothetical protein [Photobacterium rosenbergii]|uniref:Uncharacterized protein n=1 Tax=Photobacterium rosenbergii TaxID=294936 RepID=A0ABU3ZH05_9GAMM|nr:hypothetical protein [Photobacterium rosenbergii]MDV5169268.1 hypothetical protein [Photobacterium rosenbergii]